MKILAAIPSKDRTLGKMIRVLEPLVDQILVYSVNATLDYESDNTVVVEQQTKGITAARNEISLYALKHGFDWTIQIDDDIHFQPELIVDMKKVCALNSTLGFVGSSSRLEYYWSRETKANRGFLMVGMVGQMWAVNSALFKDYAYPWFGSANVGEDRYACYQSWRVGRAVVRMNNNPEFHHNHMEPRWQNNKVGGQTWQDRADCIDETVAQLRSFVGKHDMLTHASKRVRKDGGQTFQVRHNYKEMTARAIARYGFQGYRDSKGRTF